MRKIALIAVLLMLCISGAAFAQDMVEFCGDLSEADCAILTNSQEASANLDSAAYDFEINIDISNIPDEPDSVSFSMTGNGAYSGISGLQSAMTEMATDPGAMIVSVLEALDADFSLTFNFPEALQQEGAPADLTLQARLVDGVGYFNFDTLQDLIDDPSLQGWMGLDLANFLRDLMEQMPDMFTDMQAFAMSSGDMMQYMEAFQDPEFLGSFMSISRVDDGSSDVATFEMSFDFSSLMTIPEMQDMIRQQMEAQGMGSMTDEEIEQALAMVSQMYKGMTLILTEEIGVNDGYVRSVHGTFAFDMSGMMAAMPNTADEVTPNINVDFTLTYSGFNDIPEITAPEGATIVPYESLLGMMGGMMAMSSSQMGALMAAPPLPTATPSS